MIENVDPDRVIAGVMDRIKREKSEALTFKKVERSKRRR